MNLRLITMFVACIVCLVMGTESLVFGETGGQGSIFVYGMIQDSTVGNMTSDVNSHGMMNSPLSKLGSNTSNQTATNTTLGNSSENKINNNITTKLSVETPTSIIPTWVKTIFKLYGNGDVSDNELINAIQYLITNGIIKLS